ncbi:hypothetical protein AC629_10755 [Bradyrhizobium sp. NAS80.1]|nr:hypothetical protein AC629_10755 [Bradyrhizobium sp. NAS80.1]
MFEVIALTRDEVLKNGVSVRTQLAEGLPVIRADRVQLQQVILNLIINAVEAMSGVGEGERELLISTGRDSSSGVLVSLRDSGPGLGPKSLDRLFEAFYTTKAKAKGMGMGLAISRSIIAAHGDGCGPAPMNRGGQYFSSAFLPEAKGEHEPDRQGKGAGEPVLIIQATCDTCFTCLRSRHSPLAK